LKDLATATVSRSSVLKSVLNPKDNFLGDYTMRQITAQMPINESQRRIVQSLKFALEKIQGPPGRLNA